MCRATGAEPAERGIAALSVTLLLALAGLLVVAYTQRHVIVESRASANALRTAQAFEAAQAGIDWTVAMLDDASRIDEACRPSIEPTDRSFRDRRLTRAADPNSRFEPMTWRPAGLELPLAAACVHGSAGWQCSCPGNAEPSPAVAATDDTTPAFRVQIEPGPAPDVLRVVATGCLRADGACAAMVDTAHAAAARVEVLVALLPALRRLPGAAVVVGGSFVAASTATIVNPEGVAIHAGGAVIGDLMRVAGPAGSALDDTLASGDTELAALDADRHFARWFGMTRTAWRDQPAAKVVRCEGECSVALATASAAGHQLLVVDGDLDLDGPLVLGSASRPVALVVTGAARWRGDLSLHGVVHAESFDWRGAGAAASIQGALLVHRDASIEGTVTIRRDADVLAALRRGTGSLVPVDGSWKDF